MCHTICRDVRDRQTVYYRDEGGPASAWLYGWKIVIVVPVVKPERKIIIRAPYTYVQYRVDWGSRGIELEAKPCMQELKMYLPAARRADGRMTVEQAGPIQSQTLGGIHVSPFYLSGKHKRLLLGPGPNGALDADPPGLVVPVCFMDRDILFYDGCDVSVSRVWIPFHVPEPVARAGKGYFWPALRQLRKAEGLIC